MTDLRKPDDLRKIADDLDTAKAKKMQKRGKYRGLDYDYKMALKTY
jgi:hypothetical protein